MTKVQVTRTADGAVRSIRVAGHSGYAEEGEDIVCAAISALTMTTMNCLTDLLKEPAEVTEDEEKAEIRCCFQQVPSEKAAFLIECYLFGLERIREDYGKKYLSIRIQEE